MIWWRTFSRKVFDELARVLPKDLPEHLRLTGREKWLAAAVERARQIPASRNPPWHALLLLMDVDLAAGIYRITDSWIIDEYAATRSEKAKAYAEEYRQRREAQAEGQGQAEAEGQAEGQAQAQAEGAS